MSKKVLFAANLESFFTKFLIPQLKMFKEKGYEVTIAAKLEGLDIPYCDKKIDINFARSLNPKQNIESYKQMKKVFMNEHYDVVSCHTPMGGAITRLAYKNCKVKNTKMVYMAHGFHFYKGAPLFNWLVYYPIEKYLAKYTDDLITINLEDYERAKKKFKTNVHYVKGIGLDTNKFDFTFSEKDRVDYRKSLGLMSNDFVMIYPAELLPRKRQMWLLKALQPLLKKHAEFKVLLPGKDSMNSECQKFAQQLGVEKQVMFLGFRQDVPQLIKLSNLAVSTSKQEGLPVNVMEAMYCGLPVVATDCRGNRDLIETEKNGYIVDAKDSGAFCHKIEYVSKLSDKQIEKMTKISEKIVKQYLLDEVVVEISKIYDLGEKNNAKKGNKNRT